MHERGRIVVTRVNGDSLECFAPQFQMCDDCTWPLTRVSLMLVKVPSMRASLAFFLGTPLHRPVAQSPVCAVVPHMERLKNRANQLVNA